MDVVAARKDNKKKLKNELFRAIFELFYNIMK